MNSIFYGIGALVAAAVTAMTGFGIIIGIPLFFLSCFLIAKGVLQLFWGAAKIGAKGAAAGVKAVKAKDNVA